MARGAKCPIRAGFAAKIGSFARFGRQLGNGGAVIRR